MQKSLWSQFSTDKEIENYICSAVEESFKKAIIQRGTKHYLNIVPVENFGAFPATFNFGEKGFTHDILIRQLDIYMPIIRKFMLDN